MSYTRRRHNTKDHADGCLLVEEKEMPATQNLVNFLLQYILSHYLLIY